MAKKEDTKKEDAPKKEPSPLPPRGKFFVDGIEVEGNPRGKLEAIRFAKKQFKGTGKKIVWDEVEYVAGWKLAKAKK